LLRTIGAANNGGAFATPKTGFVMLKALLLALALLFALPALAQTAADTDKKIDDLLGPHAIYANAITALKTAIANHDPISVAGYLSLGDPLKVNGKDVTIADLDELTAQFDTLFTPKVISAVTAQKYETLMVNADGIMFGDGELWISGVCDDTACQLPFINITAINNQ
jgi:hypothetical protein